jgi:hypothetical protein
MEVEYDQEPAYSLGELVAFGNADLNLKIDDTTTYEAICEQIFTLYPWAKKFSQFEAPSSAKQIWLAVEDSWSANRDATAKDLGFKSYTNRMYAKGIMSTSIHSFRKSNDLFPSRRAVCFVSAIMRKSSVAFFGLPLQTSRATITRRSTSSAVERRCSSI